MKLVSRTLSLLVMTGMAVFFMGCDGGGGEDKTQQEKQLIKLNSTWSLSKVNNDGTDRNDFLNIKLEITGTYAQDGTYNYKFSSGGTLPNPSPWPKYGTWKFGANPLTEIIRDPVSSSSTNPNSEIDMNYEVTDSQLIITFVIPDGSLGWAGGTTRAKAVKGNWRFEFTKQ